jgi:hypothetical protein
LARKIAKASLTMSRLQVAKTFEIVTPAGLPNKRAVKYLADGYLPKREDTLRRWGLLKPATPRPVIEPSRRVLIGAWKRGRRWVSPEEYFGARS